MASNYKVLGQAAPAATTDATIYTCPAAGQTVISTIVICNRGATATTFRLRVAIDGAAVANGQYLFFDAVIAANQTVVFTGGITVDAADTIVGQAASANVSFQAFGQETV